MLRRVLGLLVPMSVVIILTAYNIINFGYLDGALATFIVLTIAVTFAVCVVLLYDRVLASARNVPDKKVDNFLHELEDSIPSTSEQYIISGLSENYGEEFIRDAVQALTIERYSSTAHVVSMLYDQDIIVDGNAALRIVQGLRKRIEKIHPDGNDEVQEHV